MRWTDAGCGRDRGRAEERSEAPFAHARPLGRLRAAMSRNAQAVLGPAPMRGLLAASSVTRGPTAAHDLSHSTQR
jgi:hypothetical protein